MGVMQEIKSIDSISDYLREVQSQRAKWSKKIIGGVNEIWFRGANHMSHRLLPGSYRPEAKLYDLYGPRAFYLF